ncbi:hypothetical protein OEZ60_01285 [Defluviimonas sp. WL0024]|uniref:Uncharacterized protein n=1 Tax=Albidovulum salinarum TaxID=2984153 RepID=A0ABT2WY89_9RHOB|nr:hypothetical protein [Defluviimonas sp. WL0024]MCU9846638.1 hypothetical protein [Defluviimonas sp. WL0024]
MSTDLHELAPHHLPPFITAPGSSDFLYNVIVVSLVVIVLLVGNFYFKLHALPEKMAEHANSTQLQLIGVMALLALFTHNHIFWVGALLLAAIQLPNFTEPLNSIAGSLRELSKGAAKNAPEAPAVAADAAASEQA